jgi:hypothetical protein
MSVPAATLDAIRGVTTPELTLPAIEWLEAADRTAAGQFWRQLERDHGAGGLTSSWDWIEPWLECFGRDVEHRFAIGWAGPRPIGIALVTHGRGHRRAGLPIRTIHLGTAGEAPRSGVCVEYNRLLADPAHRDGFAASLVGAIAPRRLGRGFIQLDGFDPAEAASLAARLPGAVVREKPCYIADLAAVRAAGDLKSALDNGIVAKIRKNRRRYEERFGPLESEWVEEVQRAQELFSELIELHQARWQRSGEPGSFADPRFTALHRALIDRLLPSGRLVLFRVTAGGTTVGSFYGFVERGTLYHYQWGLAESGDNALSPGFVVGAECMLEAARRGLDRLDWLAGEVRYKRELSTSSGSLVWIAWHPSRIIRALGHRLAARDHAVAPEASR